MSRDMSGLDRIMSEVAGLSKREKLHETNWRLYHLIRVEKQLWITLETTAGSRDILVAKGTYVGALLRYGKVEYIPEAKLTKNCRECNLAERIDENNCTIAYK